MSLIRLVLLFSLTIITQKNWACSCFNIPCTFFENEIRPEDHVVHVRVIGESRMEGGSRYAQMNDKLTQLLVIHEYTDKSIADTLLFYHGDGAMCFRGLPRTDVGVEYILLISPLSGELTNPKYLGIYRMNLCSRPLLEVKRKRVRGMVNRNYPCKKLHAAILKNQDLPASEKIDLGSYLMARSRRQGKSLKKFKRLWMRDHGVA